MCVCLSLYLSLCLYFCLFFVFVFLIIFFCSLSLPADDDHHEFEPAGSKLNRSYFKMNPTSETGIWAYFSYFSTVFLYFCRSGRSVSVPPPPRAISRLDFGQFQSAEIVLWKIDPFCLHRSVGRKGMEKSSSSRQHHHRNLFIVIKGFDRHKIVIEIVIFWQSSRIFTIGRLERERE